MLQENYFFLFMTALSYFWKNTEKVKLNRLEYDACRESK